MYEILKSIYEDKKDRWGQNSNIYGVFDLDENGEKYWSGLNFINTNYTMLFFIHNFLEEKTNEKIEYLFFDDYFKTLSSLKKFFRLMKDYKEELFFDGETKSILLSLHEKSWTTGEKNSEDFIINSKNYFEEEIEYIKSNDNKKGDVNDMLDGSDCYIKFINDDNIYLCQIKTASFYFESENSYNFKCIVDLNRYKKINYFVIYCKNDIYIFENDNNSLRNVKLNNINYISFDKNILSFKGETTK